MYRVLISKVKAMTENDYWNLATIVVDRAEKKLERDEELHTFKAPEYPKGAKKIGFDMPEYLRILNIFTMNLRTMSFNILPILYNLGMVRKEYFFKYGGMHGEDLKKAIIEDFLSLGGSYGVFGQIFKEYKLDGCLSCGKFDKKFWPLISLEFVGANRMHGYPCPFRFKLDYEALKVFFDVWITDKRVLEKRKEHEQILEAINKFLENKVNRGLIVKYFASVFDDEGRVIANTGINSHYYDDAIKEDRK